MGGPASAVFSAALAVPALHALAPRIPIRASERSGILGRRAFAFRAVGDGDQEGTRGRRDSLRKRKGFYPPNRERTMR